MASNHLVIRLLLPICMLSLLVSFALGQQPQTPTDRDAPGTVQQDAGQPNAAQGGNGKQDIAPGSRNPNEPLRLAIVVRSDLPLKASVGREFRFTPELIALPTEKVRFYIVHGSGRAAIDSETGEFRFTPNHVGRFSFTIGASDLDDSSRSATATFAIQVMRFENVFGYGFFAQPRAIIDGRLANLRNGNLPGLREPAGLAGDRNRVGSRGAGVGQNNGSYPRTGQGADQANAQTPGGDQTNSTYPAMNKNEGSSVGDATTPNTSTDANGVPQVANGSDKTGNNLTGPRGVTGQSPSPVGSETIDWPRPLDASSYLVSPADMLGSNVFSSTPERYQLGPGDVLSVRYWSPTTSSNDLDIKIDSGGAVLLPPISKRIVLRGLDLAHAQDLLRTLLRDYLRGADVSVTLKALRTMSVTVLGDAYLPGTYQVPSVTTLFNFIYACGGPSDNGSLRNIELRRRDGTHRVLDLYRFLVVGDTKDDVPLEPGDVIVVPPAGKHVTIEGEVKRQATYELTDTDRITDLVTYAGGAKATGLVSQITLETVEPGVGRRLQQVDLSSGSAPKVPLYDGDVVTVGSLREVYTNKITLEGAVDQPGDYAYLSGLNVSGLIRMARGLLPEAVEDRADLFRENPDQTQTLVPINLKEALNGDPSANLALRPNDRLVVYSLTDVEWMGNRKVTVEGAARRPGVYYRADNMTVADLLLQAGGVTPDAARSGIYLRRLNPDGTNGSSTFIDLMKMAAGDADANPRLSDRDTLQIPTVRESRYIPEQIVTISGAVQAPGPYPRSSNMRLSDLIKIAGGVLPDSSDEVSVAHARVPESTQPTKFSISQVLSHAPANDILLSDGDLVAINKRNDITMKPRSVNVLGAVNKAGPFVIGIGDRLSDVLARVGGLRKTAFLEGTQFHRSPELLKPQRDQNLEAKLLLQLNIINEAEYRRSSAHAIAEASKTGATGASDSGFPLLSATAQAPATTPKTPISPQVAAQLVTPARTLSTDELTVSGNLNVDAVQALRHKKGIADLTLEDGDVIYIPDRPTSVNVIGAVAVPSAVIYLAQHNVGYYIDHSGGSTIDAALDRIIIVRANGLFVKANRGSEVELGDEIFVPTKSISVSIVDKPSAIDSVSKNALNALLFVALIRSIIP